MKTLKKILLGLGILILLLILVAFLLPRKYEVLRSTHIKSNKMVIYNLVAYFNHWDQWAVWTKEMDSTAVFTLAGTDGLVGSSWSWEGKKLGNGSMSATELKPGEFIGYDLQFDHGKFQSKGSIQIEAKGDSCKVTWKDAGDLGFNPISRYFGLMMDKMMGPDFEKGLTNLKTIAEARSDWPEIIEKTMPAITALVIKDSAGPKTFGDVMGKAYMEIMNYANSNKLQITGAPFAEYLKWDSVTYFAVMDLGIPVASAKTGKGRIGVEQIPEQKVVMARYFGPYDKTEKVYRILDQYVKENGLTEAGGPWEVYVTDPVQEKDPMKVETDILFPVK